MRRALILAAGIGLLLAVLFTGNALALFGSAPAPVPASETSSVSAAPLPTATYVSELGPAVMLPPRQPAALPASGTGGGAPISWPRPTGLALALLGVLLIHVALTMRAKATP